MIRSILTVLLAAATAASAEKVKLASSTSGGCRTPWQIINATKAFSAFAKAAANDAALVALLSDRDAPISVLVPTNDALAELSDDLDLSRKALLSDPLSAVVARAHVLDFAAPLRDVYPAAANVTNMLGQRVRLESPAGLAAAAADAAAADAPAPATAATEVAPRSKQAPRKTGTGARRLAQTYAADDAPAPAAASTSTSTSTSTSNAGTGFLNAILGLFGSLFSNNGSGSTASPDYKSAKAKHSCVGGCTAAKDWRAIAGGRNASILAGNGRTCGGYVHAVDTVLLPVLVEQKGGKGGSTVFVVGDGVGPDGKTKAATVTVPASLAKANVTVARVDGKKFGGDKVGVAAPAPQPTPTAVDDAAPPPAAAAGATIAPAGVKVEPKGKAVVAPAPTAAGKKGAVPA